MTQGKFCSYLFQQGSYQLFCDRWPIAWFSPILRSHLFQKGPTSCLVACGQWHDSGQILLLLVPTRVPSAVMWHVAYRMIQHNFTVSPVPKGSHQLFGPVEGSVVEGVGGLNDVRGHNSFFALKYFRSTHQWTQIFGLTQILKGRNLIRST
jgi:hypothetical protein